MKIINLNNCILFFLVILQCTFFLKIQYISICIILLFLFFLTQLKKIRYFDIPKIKWFYFFYFLILIIGGINSNNLSYYFKDLEQNLSFLAMPIITQLFFFLNKKQMLFLKKAFVFMATLTLTVCLFRALKDYYNTGYYKLLNPDGVLDRNRFFYHEFTRYVGFHALYLAFYLSLSLIFLLQFFNFFKNKLIIVFLIFYTILGIFLCKSAIFYFITFLLLFYHVFFDFRFNFYLKYLLLFFSIIGVFFMIQFKLKTFSFSFQVNEMLNNLTPINNRFLKWYSTIEILKNNFFIGVGTGDYMDELIFKYKEIDFTEGFKYKYNPHNQILIVLLKNGLIGLVFFSMIFIDFLKRAFKVKKIDALLFISSFFIFCSVESVFERQRGLVFVLYFILFFYYDIYLTNTSNEKS